MPLVEAYVVTAFCLDKLVGRELLESELVKEVLEEMKRRLADNSLSYGGCFMICFLGFMYFVYRGECLCGSR